VEVVLVAQLVQREQLAIVRALVVLMVEVLVGMEVLAQGAAVEPFVSCGPATLVHSHQPAQAHLNY
jgi:hypothetical protein